MKTDKFDDAIRRKLESIEPPFRERDWSHMQAFMHHHGYPPAWVGASQWLMPMAAAAAVTGLIIATVWQFHTNQQLSQSVQMLSQTVTRLESTQAKLIKLQTRTDTVYVTNFTKTPAPTSQAGQPTVALVQPRQREVPVDRQEASNALQPTDSPVDNRQPVRTDKPIAPSVPGFPQQPGINPSTPTNRLAQQVSPARRSTDQPAGSATVPGASAQRPAVADLNGVVNTPVKTNQAVGQATNTPNEGNTITHSNGRDDRRLSGNAPGQTPLATGRTMGNQAYTPSGTSAGRPTDRPEQERVTSDALPAGRPTTLRSISPAVLASVRPLAVDSAYYLERIASRTRRIRSLWPTTATTVPAVPATSAPTEVASSRPIFAGVRVRLGVAGEISSALQTLGVYSEVVIGKHWSVGVGLNKLNREGGQYTNDEQFDRMTHTDFRQLYAPGNPLIHDITNIDRQFTIWQLPVSLGYRAALSNGFAITPSVGMNFSLSAQDNTTFTYRRGFEFPHVAGKQQNRPCDSFNAYTVAVGAEKSWKHLVLQAGPVLSMPTKVSPDAINPVTLGLRTRVLFQF